MKTTASVFKLHFAKREEALLAPLGSILITLVITAIISFVLQRSGLDSSSPDYAAGARSNPGMMYALPGFLVYLGVQAVATTFPFAMSLGSSRSSFAKGTALTFVTLAAYVTAVMTVLLALEKLTNQWFAGIYALDVYVLGAGDFGLLIPIVFFASLAFMSIGSAFGAVYVRYQARGPLAMGLLLALLIAGAALLLVPYFEEIIAGFNLWWGILLGTTICGVSLMGMRLALGRASVR